MKKLTIALAVILLAGFSIAHAQCRDGGNIQFARGKTHGTVRGTVTAGKAVCYKFRVSKEQDVKLRLTSAARTATFGIAEDAGDSDEIATNVTDWNTVAKGAFIVSVRVAKGSTAFALTLVIGKDDYTGANTVADDAYGVPFPADSVPEIAGRVQDFIPKDWRLGKTADGDLNGDGRPDKVITLESGEEYENTGVPPAPDGQALLILLSEGGKFRRAAMALKLLRTSVPQYSLDVSIKKGVLSVSQDFGMDEVNSITDRFRLDPTVGRFLLIGADSYSYSRPLSGDTLKFSDNYVTGVRIRTEGKFNRATGTVKETTTQEHMSKIGTMYIEDLSENP